MREATASEAAASKPPEPKRRAPKTFNAPVHGFDVPEPRNLRFDDLPEPQFLRALPPTDDDSQELPPVRQSSPLPSTQDTMPLPEPPLKRGEDWAEDAVEDEPPVGFGAYNPAETAPFVPNGPSVGQEPFGGQDLPVPPETGQTMVPEEASPEDPDSVDLARETFGGGASATWPPEDDDDEAVASSSNSGLAIGLVAIGLFAVLGGGGFMLWNNSNKTVEEPVAAEVEAPVEKPVEVKPEKKPTKKPTKKPPKKPPVVVEAADDPATAPPNPGEEPAVTSVEDTTPEVIRVQPESNPVRTTASTALLSVSTDPPGAVVWIDDKKAGTAPVAMDVTIGSHTVKASLNGYVTQTVRVSADEGGSSARIPLKAKPSADAMVKLFGQPGSQVFVDGRNVGTLPVSIPLKVGSHGFRVVTPNGVSYEVTKDVAGSTTSLSLLPD